MRNLAPRRRHKPNIRRVGGGWWGVNCPDCQNWADIFSSYRGAHNYSIRHEQSDGRDRISTHDF